MGYAPGRKSTSIVVTLAALSAILFLATGLAYTGGRLVPPLDDTAIHIKYAEQIARSQYYRYNDGDPQTSGATSWLYAHLLAICALFGLRGAVLMGFSLLLGGFFFCLATLVATRLTGGYGCITQRRLGLLLAFHGPLLWICMSGMEVALFSLLLLSVLLSYWNESRVAPTGSAYRVTSFLAALLALVRPEGGFAAVIVACAMSARMFGAGVDCRRIAKSIILPVGPGVLWPYLWTRLSTGAWSSSGLLAKSLFAEPTMTWPEKVTRLAENFTGVVSWLLGKPAYGGWSMEYLPPGGAVLACLGLVSLARRSPDGGWRQFVGVGPVSAACILVISASVSTLSVWHLHNYRYLLPVVPLFMFLLVVGLDEIGRWGIYGRLCSQLLFIVLMVGQLVMMPVWISRYGRNCGSIAAKQYGLAKWIASNTPPETRVAVNDAGILALFSQRRIVDLVGLMHRETTVPYRLGEGALYEYLSDLPEDQRFDYYAVFPEWFELFGTFDVLGDPIIRFPDPFNSGYEKVLYRAAWRTRGIDASPRPSAATRPDWVLVDRLDVANVAGEREHSYICRPSGVFPPDPVPFRRNFGYHEEIEELFPDVKDERLIPWLASQGELEKFDILDAGRRHSGSESFRIRGLRPGVDLAIVLRSCQDKPKGEIFEYEMVVSLGGRFAGNWKISGTPWNWYERWLIIPGSLVTQPEMQVEVTAVPTETDPYYASYYYWFLQPPT